MELRIFTEPQQGATYDDQLRLAQAAEQLGFDGFFRSDHYLVMGDRDPMPGPTDAMVTLAGLARETSRIKLGTLVCSATFRNPGVMAISAAQIDQMSGGRLELGLGAGWYEKEHQAYGIPFPALGERFDVLEEQLAILTGLWQTPVDEQFNFDGKHYQVSNSPALPKPAQPTIPLIIGGSGARRTPTLAAKYAAEFNRAFAPIEEQKRLFDGVLAKCDEIGRDRSTLVLSSAMVACIGTSDADVAKRAAAIGREVDELKQNGLAGSPQEVLDKIGLIAEAGATRLYLQILDMSDLDHVQLIADEVQSKL